MLIMYFIFYIKSTYFCRFNYFPSNPKSVLRVQSNIIIFIDNFQIKLKDLVKMTNFIRLKF